MNLGTRLKNWFRGPGMEGEDRSPFYGRGEFGGVYELGWADDGFQRNLTLPEALDPKKIPAAYASVMANARAVSQCAPKYKRRNDEGKWEDVEDGFVADLLRTPNQYETWPQFILNAVAQLYFAGESYSLVLRDDRGRITSLHRMHDKSCTPYVTEGELFYSVSTSGNPFVPDEMEFMVPARDVLHLRIHTPRHPLMGESPIKAAALAAGINVSLSGSQAAFFHQMSRPSGVLSTDQVLNKDQLVSLREAWSQQSSKLAQGSVPILSGGLKWQAMSITSQDAQLMEAQRFSVEEIARCYGVPLPIIGDMTSSTLNNVEQLISFWLSVSLSSLLENLERSLSKLLMLPYTEKIDFDVTGLLRADFQTRIDGLTKAVQGGLYTPNEARAKEGLHPIDKGDVVYMQAQMEEIGITPEPPVEPPAQPVVEQSFKPEAFAKALRA